MPRKKAPNGTGMLPKQRPDGRWEARYCVPDPSTGTLKRKSVYAKTQEECAKKLRKATASIDEGTYQEPSKLTVGKWADIWKAEYWGSLKPRTADQYDMHLRLNIKPNIGGVKLQALGAHSIQSMYNKLQHREKPLSAKSIRNLHGVVHSMLKQAQKLGYIKVNPAEGCNLPRAEKREMLAIMDDKLDEFLSAINGHKYESVFLVDVFTGLRQGEILGLTWQDVDFTKGKIYVRKQLQKERKKGGEYKRVSLKNDKTRPITPAPFVMDVLKAEQRRQKENRLRAGSAWDNSMNLVFTNELGRYLASSTVYNNFKAIVKRIGLDEVRMHDLRHTFAMLSLQNGVDIKTLQQELGHATSSFTLDVYGHVSDEMLKASAKSMQRYINEWKTRR